MKYIMIFSFAAILPWSADAGAHNFSCGSGIKSVEVFGRLCTASCVTAKHKVIVIGNKILFSDGGPVDQGLEIPINGQTDAPPETIGIEPRDRLKFPGARMKKTARSKLDRNLISVSMVQQMTGAGLGVLTEVTLQMDISLEDACKRCNVTNYSAQFYLSDEYQKAYGRTSENKTLAEFHQYYCKVND
jgi:hypothetical protein